LFKKYFTIFFVIGLAVTGFSKDNIDLAGEYSSSEFQKGVIAFHKTEYELAISYFTKALGYKEDNFQARYFLGDSYRKAGYEENALFVWNTLLSMGYDDRSLKSRVAHLYDKRGMLTDIFIDKDYILRDDIKGFIEGDKKSVPSFIKPAQIAVDKNNHYFVASYLTGTVCEFDPNMKIVRNYMSALQEIKNPFGIAIDGDGYLYISDFTNDVIVKLNRYNIIEKKIGFKGVGQGGLLGPKNLIFDDDENLYVTDSGNKRINKYKKDGEFLFSFGNNLDDNSLKNPGGIFFDGGKIYVCDREADKVLVFDKNGNFLNAFGDAVLKEPYDITRDKLGRFLVLCKEKIWAYEEDNVLWYPIEETGNRLKRGLSVVTDKENNILVTDFDTSRLLVLSLARQRYSNLNVNIERIYSQKFREVHLALTVEKDDGSMPEGVGAGNIFIYENGKNVPVFGTAYTENKNNNSDILVVYDKNRNMAKNSHDFKVTMDNWLKTASTTTRVSLVTARKQEPLLENDFNSSRLQILDSLDNGEYSQVTDKGSAVKTGIYHMLNRFSKKAVIIVTDGTETGNDFEMFKIDDCINLAKNNDIKIYVVSFGDGPLTEIYRQIAKKTEGDYYRVYRRNDLQDLFKRIEKSKGRQMIVSYRSNSVSRFGDEPISVYVEINYEGMKGIGQSLYYPGN
jgi:DNA-binding beta-propeller fold protein YncE